MLPNCFYACAYQVHDCGFFFFVIDDKFTSYIFQDALTFQSAIALCYITQFVALQFHVPSPRTWAICEAIMKVMSPIVNGCVLN